MKIKDIIKNNKTTVSFEVFPPKEWSKIETTKAVVDEMTESHPAFMSVTYGAAGTTSGFTTEIAQEILSKGITPLAHLTCLTSTRDKVRHVVQEMKETGVVKFEKIVERFGENDNAMKQAGIVYAAEQIIDLMANGVNNIHIYTMNKPDVAAAIVRELGDIINE